MLIGFGGRLPLLLGTEAIVQPDAGTLVGYHRPLQGVATTSAHELPLWLTSVEVSPCQHSSQVKSMYARAIAATVYQELSKQNRTAHSSASAFDRAYLGYLPVYYQYSYKARTKNKVLPSSSLDFFTFRQSYACTNGTEGTAVCAVTSYGISYI